MAEASETLTVNVDQASLRESMNEINALFRDVNNVRGIAIGMRYKPPRRKCRNPTKNTHTPSESGL
jgi:hypothetical protein